MSNSEDESDVKNKVKIQRSQKVHKKSTVRGRLLQFVPCIRIVLSGVQKIGRSY